VTALIGPRNFLAGSDAEFDTYKMSLSLTGNTGVAWSALNRANYLQANTVEMPSRLAVSLAE